jgi:hypothetical protein
MEKESKLFDKRFVHFMWDDELKGKQCFVADNIGVLKAYVESCESRSGRVVESGDNGYPFLYDDADERCGSMYQFAYYDPNYEAKKAYNEGKEIQCYVGDGWIPVSNPSWNVDTKYRAKPEEEKWIVYLARYQDGLTLCCSAKSYWETAKKFDGAKGKLFVGTKNEVVEWYKPRQKFVEVIEAWEDGKMIQIRHTPNSDWVDLDNESPKWHTCYEYRVKPECHCEEGIDSKACAGCPQNEAREIRCENCQTVKDANGVCYLSADGRCKDGSLFLQKEKLLQKKKNCRPFKDCDELVEFWSKNYQTGFRPANTKPLIWVRLKVDKRERLIVAFGTNFVEIGNKAKAVTLQKLFDDYEFLDGSPVGMKE